MGATECNAYIPTTRPCRLNAKCSSTLTEVGNAPLSASSRRSGTHVDPFEKSKTVRNQLFITS
jgi:hypothetical protein